MNATKMKAGMDFGEDRFMTWMSSFNASLLSTFSSLSCESQSKLRDLYSLNYQADASADEVIKSLNRISSEYEALCKQVDNCFQVLGLDDKEDFSSKVLKEIQDIGTVICAGNIRDGTDIGAVSCLATDVFAKATLARQKISLVKDIKTIQRKNVRLKEALQYFEKESKMASEEAISLQSELDTDLDVKIIETDAFKLAENVSALRSELEGLGVSSAISSQTILDTYQSYMLLGNEIKILQSKLKQYGELPPSIAESSKIVAAKKEHLATVVADFKSKLTAAYSRGR